MFTGATMVLASTVIAASLITLDPEGVFVGLYLTAAALETASYTKEAGPKANLQGAVNRWAESIPDILSELLP